MINLLNVNDFWRQSMEMIIVNRPLCGESRVCVVIFMNAKWSDEKWRRSFRWQRPKSRHVQIVSYAIFGERTNKNNWKSPVKKRELLIDASGDRLIEDFRTIPIGTLAGSSRGHNIRRRQPNQHWTWWGPKIRFIELHRVNATTISIHVSQAASLAPNRQHNPLTISRPTCGGSNIYPNWHRIGDLEVRCHLPRRAIPITQGFCESPRQHL